VPLAETFYYINIKTQQIADPGDPADRNSARTLEYANFKRNVYHKVVDVIFDPMKGASYNGMALYCGDKIKRVLYPGIPIEALDGEEACSACACRAALANYPCPRCLVHHNQLDMIDKKYPP
jgi:Plavaka transposase